MRWTGLFWTVAALPVVLATGCADPHPAAVYVVPPEAPLSPTSSRAVPRVYSVPPPSGAPQGVAPGDLAVAESVSDLLKGSPHLAGASSDVLVTVKHGIVTLRGNVFTEHDRDEIVERISRLPGVYGVDDKLGISLR